MTTEAEVLEEESPVIVEEESPAVAAVEGEIAAEDDSQAQISPDPAEEPVEAKPPPVKSERRKERRHVVSWRAAISIPQNAENIYCQGRMLDVSMSGFSMLVARSLDPYQTVAICLELPGIHSGQAAEIIEIDGRIVLAVLSSKYNSFFVSLEFTHFKADAKTQLQARIASLPDFL